MSIVLLNIVLGTIALIIAGVLTLIAVALIIISLVRSSRAKKEGKKTAKVGLWIGIIMLAAPWLIIAFFFIGGKVMDSNYNRMDVDKGILAQAVLASDHDDLYDMLADDVVDRNDLDEEDLEEFLSRCRIENTSSSDMERYSDFASQDSHYRNYTSRVNGRNQLCFQFSMYDVNDDGGEIYIAGVDGDAKGEEYVGIYYISYTEDDVSISFGEKPPKEP
ncbi:MAG: DUF456 domain-containing protein [Clostridiales bacterium]|nr:DUF456 domain-containing protein [Clostridiales bacterium]